MDIKTSRDWGSFFLGIAFIITGLIFFAVPNLTLVAIATVAGAWLLVVGAFGIYEYARYHDDLGLSGWDLAYAICDVVLGLMFLIHPIVTSAVIPWVAGVFMAAYGIFEIVLAAQMQGAPGRGWVIANGIVSILCALTFFLLPALFAVFLGVFMVFQGVTLAVSGITSKVITYHTGSHHHAA